MSAKQNSVWCSHCLAQVGQIWQHAILFILPKSVTRNQSKCQTSAFIMRKEKGDRKDLTDITGVSMAQMLKLFQNLKMCKGNPVKSDLQSLGTRLKFNQLLPSRSTGMDVAWWSGGQHATVSWVRGTPSETRMTRRRAWRGSVPADAYAFSVGGKSLWRYKCQLR